MVMSVIQIGSYLIVERVIVGRVIVGRVIGGEGLWRG